MWRRSLLLLAPLLVGATDRVELNVISRVEVVEGQVVISGTRRPSFTTFSLVDPPRLVVDVAEAVFQGVPAELKVQDGTILSIKTASFGTEASAIARILVSFQREVAADLATRGNDLLVKLPADPARAALLARQEAEARARKVEAERLAREEAERQAREEQARQKAEALARAKEEADERARAQALEREARLKAAEEAKARAQAEKLAREEAERQAREEQARQRAEALARAREAAEERARAQALEREARLKAAEEARARAQAEKLARQEAERQAREEQARQKAEALARAREDAEAKARAQAQEREARLRAAEEARARAQAEKLARQEAERQAREEQARQKAEALARAKEDAEAKARVQAQARAEAQARLEAERAWVHAEVPRASSAGRVDSSAGGEEPEGGPGAGPQLARVGPAEEEARRQERERALQAAALATPPPSELARGPARMTGVGFRQESGVGRVLVRTTSPVRYAVGEDALRNVVLTLENTQLTIPASQRIVDTSFFDTAVSLVRPEELGEGKVRVTITLKKAVAYRASQLGNELTLTFERPPGW